MSSPLTNDFNDIIEVAKSISALSASSVSIHPNISVRNENVRIESCHLCLIPAETIALEEKLAFADFIPMSSREDEDGLQWDEWERENLRISIGKKV